MLRYTLLGFLNYWPMSGYDLKQAMDRSTTHFWHAKLSQVYTTLKALEKEGCVTSLVEEGQERPDRRVYTITGQGRQELRDWLAQPYAELSPKKEGLVLKVFFSAQMDRQTILTQLRLQRDLHRQQVTYYRDVTTQTLQQVAAGHPELARDALLWEATRRFGEMYEQLYVRWLEETIQLVEEQFDEPG
ncbi:MAG: PadR family transcriptional regulator [Thermoflexales bacterium]|nr:PadR family transcriptional regulator [Thermoflexales bacterium]